ncbi:MAG TPA: sugar phosphate isomerase/epimerase family protein [Cyclobacteriaceae bacterium]|nr:sugar phosphate isomerase/epimerase family protein [Cyclobacteriaceae bacterium]
MLRLVFIIVLIAIPIGAQAQKMWEIGVVGEIEKDSLFHSAGFTCLIDNAGRLFSPKNVSDEQFESKLAMIKASKITLMGVNVFMPGDMKLVGPAVDEQRILAHATTVFKRCKAAGVKMVVWGSGGARRIPDGFDPATARNQFIDIARKVAPIAKKYGVVLAFESLNSTETNFINTAEQALQLVQEVDHRSFRLNIDFYHMLMEGEGPAIIEKAGKYVVHCELAEKEGRSAPGVHHQDFVPYFQMMKKIKYKGKVIIECQWKDVDQQAATAYKEIEKQIKAVF